MDENTMVQAIIDAVKALEKIPEKPSMLLMSKTTWYQARRDYRSLVSYGVRHIGEHHIRERYLGGIMVYLSSRWLSPDEDIPEGKIITIPQPKFGAMRLLPRVELDFASYPSWRYGLGYIPFGNANRFSPPTLY